MEKSVEKKIEEKVGKKLGKEIKKEVEKEVKEKVEKEIVKRLGVHELIYRKAMSSALKFKKEFQSQVVTAISAALGFLVALSWRTPIQESIDEMIEYFGLTEESIYIKFLGALVITLVAVIILMLISRWKSEEE